MKLAYVTARMPFAYAEQFFEPEIDSLADTFDVTVMPTRATQPKNCYPNLRATAHYRGAFDLPILRSAVREVLRAPLAVARVLATVAFSKQALRARVVNLALFPRALALAQDVRQLGIEHMHVNWITSPATIVYVASQLTGVPYSVSAHQHDIFYDNLLEPKVRGAQFVRVISARNCRHLQERLPIELRARCHVVHLGVRLPTPAPAAAQRALRILCPARMCTWKGHRYLVEALAALREAGVPYACDLAGDGEIEADVRALVERTDLGEQVRMLGVVPHGDLVARLERGDYDAVVLASTERGGEHEGIPVALMEGMAAGLPVVATRTGSIGELVDERSGILVPQRDAAALAAALGRLASDPELRRTLGTHGRERVVANFSTAQTTRELVALLLQSAPWQRVPHRTQVGRPIFKGESGA